MFKSSSRPSWVSSTESVVARARRSRTCPSCNLNTGSHPIHSTALLGQKPRKDRDARKEFWGPGGVNETQRGLVTFREYAERRETEKNRLAGSPKLSSASGSFPFSTSSALSASLGQSAYVSRNLPSLLETFRSMSERNQRPTRTAYLELLRAAANYSHERSFKMQSKDEIANDASTASLLSQQDADVFKTHGEVGLGWKIAWSAWEDARLGGQDLGIEAFDLLIRAAMPHPQLLPSLLYYAQANPHLYAHLSAETYDRLLRAPSLASNLEQVIIILSEMRRAGYRPSAARMNQAVQIACEWEQPQLALDFAERLEAEEKKGSVEMVSWVDILRASAQCHFVDGVERGWKEAVEKGAFKPDEGLLILILNVAGRHGLTGLAEDVIRRFQTFGLEIKEYHLAPILEAFCHKSQIGDAFETLTIMRHSGACQPTLSTAQPIVELIARSTDLLDSAFFTLENLHQQGKSVDIAAFHAVLKAAEILGDLGRAIAVYGQAKPLGIQPTTETYNILLATCVKAKAKSHGLRLLDDMAGKKEGGESKVAVPWDAETYQRVIELCLTQSKFADAFDYLAKMKAAGIRPPLATYEAFVKRCVAAKDKRYRAVLEEMQLGNYKPSTDLIDYVKRHMNKIRSERAEL